MLLSESIKFLKEIAGKLTGFKKELAEFIEITDFSSIDFPRFLKELDKVIESVSTTVAPYRLSGTYSSNSPHYISHIIEQKELYDDQEIQESKVPIPSSVFIEKASKIASNNY